MWGLDPSTLTQYRLSTSSHPAMAQSTEEEGKGSWREGFGAEFEANRMRMKVVNMEYNWIKSSVKGRRNVKWNHKVNAMYKATPKAKPRIRYDCGMLLDAVLHSSLYPLWPSSVAAQQYGWIFMPPGDTLFACIWSACVRVTGGHTIEATSWRGIGRYNATV